MSNMSSRVKSMKFMQKNFKQDEEEEKKSVKDSSEWQTSSSHKLLSKKDSKIQSVGYASINSFFSVDEPLIPTPRRVYEDEESKIKSQKKVQDLASKEAPIESKPEIEDDLLALFNKSKRKHDHKDKKLKKQKK